MKYVVKTEVGFWNGTFEVLDFDTITEIKNLSTAKAEALKAKESLNSEIAIICNYGFENEEVIEVF